MRNGRAKGSVFEREVAKLFADWTGDTVRRTPMSGGWSHDEEFDVSGDLVFKHMHGIHVECKNQELWRMEDLLTGSNAHLVRAWWKQATRECPPHKYPLLVFSRRFLPIFVMRRYGGAKRHGLLHVGDPDGKKLLLVKEGLVVELLDSFLKEWKPDPKWEPTDFKRTNKAKPPVDWPVPVFKAGKRKPRPSEDDE